MNDSSLDRLLGSYMCIIDHQELSYNNDNIKYLYNFQQIKFGDKETIGEFFLNDNNPIISVMDMNYLINLIAITFKTTHGDIFQVIIKSTKTLEHLLMRYLDEILHSELINKNDKIQFLYKAQRIKFGDQANIGQFFSNDYNPIIIVMDVNNFLSNNHIPKKNIVIDFGGKICGMTINHGTTIEQLFKAFIYKYDIHELLDNYDSKFYSLRFTYNAQAYNCKNQTLIENFFKGENAKISLSL